LVSVAILAGTPGNSIDRCVQACLSAQARAVVVFATTSDARALPSPPLLDDKRVSLAHLEWNHSFARLRNEALDHMQGQWVLFVDADEWPKSSLTTLNVIEDDLDTDCVYSPVIQEIHTRANMLGIPRLVFSESANRFVGHVHEYCRRSPHAENLDCVPVRIEFCLNHDGYDPALVDLAAKASRNIELGERELSERPDDARALHFFLRDGVASHSLDRSSEILARLTSSASSGAGYTANGRSAEWYKTRSLPLATEVALRHRRVDVAEALVERMLREGSAPADGEYYRAGLKLLQGLAGGSDLSHLMKFRYENPTTGSASLSVDGRHLDAMIVALLAAVRGPEAALPYWRECDPWTDGFVDNSWPRGWGRPEGPLRL
jgi:Glycosyl transferase family 2